jgi:hypothetical protein
MRLSKSLFYLFILITLLASCQKEEEPKINERGLTPQITSIVPNWALDTLENYGMLIHGGSHPPDISGSFVASPHVLESSNIPFDYQGRVFPDFFFAFHQLNLDDLTLKFDSHNGPERAEGVGAYMVGESDRFSVFIAKEATDTNSGTTADLVCVISGKYTTSGIEDYQQALIMVDDHGDPANYFIENGQCRLFIDQDGLAEAQ